MDDELRKILGGVGAGGYPSIPFPMGMQSIVVNVFVEGKGYVIRMLPLPWVTHIPDEYADLMENGFQELVSESTLWDENGNAIPEDHVGMPAPMFIFVAIFEDGRSMVHMTPDRYEISMLYVNPMMLRDMYGEWPEARADLVPLDNDGGAIIALREMTQWWLSDILGMDAGGVDYRVPDVPDMGFISDIFKDITDSEDDDHSE